MYLYLYRTRNKLLEKYVRRIQYYKPPATILQVRKKYAENEAKIEVRQIVVSRKTMEMDKNNQKHIKTDQSW